MNSKLRIPLCWKEYLRTLTPAQLATIRTRAGKEVDSALVSGAARARRRVTPGKIWLRLRREVVRGWATFCGGSRMRTAFDEGWFRQSGEVHRVMYDEVSLAGLLLDCGFSDPKKVTAFTSGILAFGDYGLDVIDGAMRKPDSLFVEALRP